MRPLDPVVTDALGRRFGAVVALRGVGLRVGEGTCLLLLGPNGSGKTTLLRVLATALRPTEGRAWVCGYDVVSEGHRVRELCAFLGTSPGVYAGLTGFENLCLAADLCGRPRRQVAELLGWAGLEQVAHRLVRTYSLGMRRRLALARVRLQEPRVLLLDEPFVGLDEEGTRLVGELVTGIKKQKGAVVLATHDRHRARAVCDAVAELESGTLVSSGTAGLAGAVSRG
ncbi:MAG: ATP-binding cassette domain-containing protein [Armatimonadota bacterium]|nr:ATP-binding cassette domain-containing protein [Armatimonadota bacterium]MDR7461601.1 ATP-binding cassette domain-containing protein [Armatimonadota bacterium]MDR7524900.1 ATP-binding cassette domain-containing protein [Armatimonadota bacterium]MDR7565548.1 ATP-binding cassette domain-containing protein [Armatimonadota bacterium]MDR7598079.1 ATP-binding cassette domain-containing protein [Armatimonadota bacterium]